jgi:hypothetical protein
MHHKFAKLLSEEIRETKKMTLAIQQETQELRKIAEASQKKADAAWELVIMTREQINRPFWKRLFY